MVRQADQTKTLEMTKAPDQTEALDMTKAKDQTAALDMLVFAAHPDDAEIGMGATIMKHTAAGLRVGICDLTYAELSSNGNVESRQREAAAATELLGCAMRSNLGLPDRGLHGGQEQIEAIVREIRRLRPRMVMAPYWEDRHPDHVACSKLVEEAVFNAKLTKYLPDIEPWTVPALLFYFINDVVKPDLVIDVSEVHAQKMAALRAYHTQFASPDRLPGGVRTAINDEHFLARIEARDHLLGQQMNVDYAEGFMSKQPYPLEWLTAGGRDEG